MTGLDGAGRNGEKQGRTRYRLAELVEEYLGDPADAGTVFSYARCIALDEREEFPAEICRGLDAWGVPEYYVPAQFGGRLDDYEQMVQLMRALARRDLTVAIGHGKTYLGAACVWVAGIREQAERLGAQIRAGRLVSLGLTERGHGSDLLAGEVAGDKDGAHYRVTGEKWLINNATRGDLLTLLTRTEPDGGPRGFSVLLVDKRELAAGSYRCLDKVRTHGIRGADISGIAFDGALVPGEAVVGAPGSGLETVLKALQLTRILCSALSLGAGDHALALALDFVRERALYGHRLIELPKTRAALAASAADLLMAEALAVTAARAVHTLTEELSVVSAVVKYLVPTETDALIARLSGQVGARAFLKEVYARGMIQKIDRDHRVVGIFDGNTQVNLSALISQFGMLGRGYARGSGDTGGAAAAFDLGSDLPAFAPERLSLVARSGSGVLASLPDSVSVLREAAARGGSGRGAPGSPDSLYGALAAAKLLCESAERVHAEIAGRRDPVPAAEPRAFELARKYALCFAGAACLGLWARNRDAEAQAGAGAARHLWRDGTWLHATLDRVLAKIRGPRRVPDTGAAAAYERLLNHLCAARDRGELFSLLPLALAGPTTDRRARAGGTPC